MSKASETLLAKDPDHFKKIGAAGAAARKKHYMHFDHLAKTDPSKLKELGKKYGRKKKISTGKQ